MMPLPKDPTAIDAMISADPILPETLFSADPSGGGMPYSSLHVVAFRLDPCFGQLGPITDPSMCDYQLRFVLQPIHWDASNNSAFADDAAVHVFYHLTRAQFLDAVNELVAARAEDAGDDDLGPLAVHPVIAREGVTGALAQKFRTIVTKYAGEGQLFRFTSLLVELFNGGSGQPDASLDLFWALHGFDIKNGVATMMVIPTLPQPGMEVSLDVTSDPLATRFGPETTAADDISLLANFTQAQAATVAQRQAAFDAALRIENPNHHSPNTIDCGSCHMAEPARVLVGEQLGLSAAGNPNAFVTDRSSTQLIGADGGMNIHAFSYRGSEPMINQRVMNETAANLSVVESWR